MELSTAINLIKNGVPISTSGQVWADLGAGGGLFTQALATLLPEGSVIYAIDKDRAALGRMSTGKVSVKKIKMDFVTEELPEQFDGVLMANSLHFVADKVSFIKRLLKSLKKSGRLILVEYDLETASPWVPYPISFKELQGLSEKTGFESVIKIGEEPSRFNAANIYSACLTLGPT